MFFVKKPAGCVFPFQRSPLAKDYNRHAYQWLPAPLEALKLPGEFTLNDGHHFFYTNEVSKGDEIHIRWESQKCNPFLCFNFSRYASSSSSLQFAVFWERFRIFGRTHEVHPTAVHGSVSRWWVPRPPRKKNQPPRFFPKMKFTPTLPSPKISFFCRYLKDLKVLDVATSDVLIFSKLSKFEIAFLFPLPPRSTLAFPPTLGWATSGPSTVDGKSWKVGFKRAVSGAEDWRLFEKPSKKQWRKSWRLTDIFEKMTWSLFFSTEQYNIDFL